MTTNNIEMPPKPKSGKGGLIFLIVLILVIGAVAAWRLLLPEAELEDLPAQPVQVYAEQAVIGPISVSTTLTGKVRAADEATILAAGGEVRHINVAVGDYVKKGQRLFSLDSTQVQGGLAQAQVGRDMAAEGVETARINLERMQALYESAAISAAQLEQAETMYNTALNQLRQAEAAVNSAAGSISLLTFDAPINGYITELNIKEGMYPPQTQPAMAIAGLDDLEIYASVSEYLIAYLTEGAAVSFKITALGSDTFSGEIKTVALAPATGGLTYPITIAVDAQAVPGIKPGMFAEISLPANHKEEAVIVPAASIITRSGQSLVAVLNGDIPSLQPVKTGLNNGEIVEITEGLSGGETVITKGQHFIVEGEAVTRLTD